MDTRVLPGCDLLHPLESTRMTPPRPVAAGSAATIPRAAGAQIRPLEGTGGSKPPESFRRSPMRSRGGRGSGDPPVEAIALQPRSEGVPLSRWLCEGIRAAIVDGRLPPGAKLPSRMALARHYNVALGTIIAAVGQLVKQGYLDSAVGVGTYVRSARPEELREGGANRGWALARVPRRALSAGGRRLAAHAFPNARPDRSALMFRFDDPALDAFPSDTWNRLAVRRLAAGDRELLAHGEPLGYWPLRAAIADCIAARGVRCTAHQVVITSGTQQSLELAARLLLDPGDPVWMEDPGYAPATSLLRANGAQVIGVPVDDQGLDCDAGRERSRLARMAYVTPACHFPLAVPMSQARRLSLLHWASETGAWIFEDDYDGLLRLGDRIPRPPLYASDSAGSVIYSNSFNRLLFPALRLGFLILPPAFVQPAAAALSLGQRYHSPLQQAVLTDFIVEGHLELHARRLRAIHAARREALVTAVAAELGGLMQLNEPRAAGLQVTGWLAPGLSESDTWRRATAHSIHSVALSSLTIERRLPPALVLGFAGADERALRTGIKRLRRVLRGVLLSSGPPRG